MRHNALYASPMISKKLQRNIAIWPQYFDPSVSIFIDTRQKKSCSIDSVSNAKDAINESRN